MEIVFNWQNQYSRYRHYFTNLNQFSQQKRTRTYAGAILTVLTITFFLVFAIKPTLVTITKLTKEIKDQKQVAAKLQAKINSLQRAQLEYLALEPDLVFIEQSLPQNSQISLLIKQIEALSQQSGTNLKAVKFNQVNLKGNNDAAKPEPTKEPSSAKTPTVDFDLTATGDYESLKKFLNTISLLRRIVLVKSFAFQNQTDEQNTLVLSLSAQAHYLISEGQ